MCKQQLENIFTTPSASIPTCIPISRPRPRPTIRSPPISISRPRRLPEPLAIDVDESLEKFKWEKQD